MEATVILSGIYALIERHSYSENSIGSREILILGLVRWRSGAVIFCIDDEFRYVGGYIDIYLLELSFTKRETNLPPVLSFIYPIRQKT